MLYELETIELKDGDTYKDSLSLSTGQKCTAILPILLLDSDTPLLVDQPEDNLDNRFIFEAVVDSIRKVKTHRQLVFVTHNPNIPVLGDAERVFVLDSNGTAARKINEGTVNRATFLATGAESGGACFIIEVTVPPGGGPPLRIHHFEEESFYLFQRMLTIQAAGQTFQASPGDFMHIPRGTVPMFKNDGTAAAQRNGFEFVPPA